MNAALSDFSHCAIANGHFSKRDKEERREEDGGKRRWCRSRWMSANGITLHEFRIYVCVNISACGFFVLSSTATPIYLLVAIYFSYICMRYTLYCHNTYTMFFSLALKNKFFEPLFLFSENSYEREREREYFPQFSMVNILSTESKIFRFYKNLRKTKST